MRRRTRNLTLALLGVVALLLALGALPGQLRAGDPYYVVATPDGDHPALNVTNLPDRRFPFVASALSNASTQPGRSGPYWRGPVGIKEAFTHSPFDELDALRARDPAAASDGGVWVSTANGDRYLLTIQRGAGA